MSKRIQQVVLLVLIVLLLCIPVIAQDEEAAGTSTFAGRPTLWVAVVIGFGASFATVFYGNRLQGGVVGTSLYLIGAGMLLVVLGFFAVVVAWADASTQAIVHDLAFIIGYVLMLVGAFRLRQIT